MVPLNQQLRLPSDQLGLLMSLNQKEKRGLPVKSQNIYIFVSAPVPGTELLNPCNVLSDKSTEEHLWFCCVAFDPGS